MASMTTNTEPEPQTETTTTPLNIKFLGAPYEDAPPNYRKVFGGHWQRRCTEAEYQEACIQHIRAEYWAFFDNITHDAPNPGWRKNCGQVYFVPHGQGTETPKKNPQSPKAKRVKIKSAYNYHTDCDIEVDLAEELRGHLCIYREHLYFADNCALSCGCPSMMTNSAAINSNNNNNNIGNYSTKFQCIEHGEEGKTELYLTELCSMKHYHDRESACDNNHQFLLYSIGYCEDYFKSFEMLQIMLQQQRSLSETDIISDSWNEQLDHLPCLQFLCKPNECSFVTKKKQCWRNNNNKNELPNIFKNNINIGKEINLSIEQKEIINNLCKPIEFISGPPGTGKSSMVKNIIKERAYCQPNKKTLIIAAQNKAIDVLVEMFKPYANNNNQHNHDLSDGAGGGGGGSGGASSSTTYDMFVVGNSTNANMGLSACEYTVDALVNNNAEYSQILNELLDLTNNKKKLNRRNKTILEEKKLELKSKLKDLKNNIEKQIITESSIIFSTFTGLYTLYMKGDVLDKIFTVIVDEAGTVAEWQAAQLNLPCVQSIVFIGDVKQLPPFTNIKNNNYNKNKNFNNSDTQNRSNEENQNKKIYKPDGYLERITYLFKKNNMYIPMLTQQYRNHPDIAKLVSESFYDGNLTSTETATSRYFNNNNHHHQTNISGLYWLDYVEYPKTHILENRTAFKSENWIRNIEKVSIKNNNNQNNKNNKKNKNKNHDSSSTNSEQKRAEEVQEEEDEERYEEVYYYSKSYVNATELNHVLNALKVFASKSIFDTKTVAVIAFYKPQVTLLQFMISTLSTKLKNKHENGIHHKIKQAYENGQLFIQTVDSAQGSEADIVILSCVRSNPEKNIGFLGNHGGCNRICVALSRAKDALFILGDKNTLSNIPSLKFNNQRDEFNLKIIKCFYDLNNNIRNQESLYGAFSIQSSKNTSSSSIDLISPTSSSRRRREVDDMMDSLEEGSSFEAFEDDFM
jgi:septum formation inhibitor MinC